MKTPTKEQFDHLEDELKQDDISKLTNDQLTERLKDWVSFHPSLLKILPILLLRTITSESYSDLKESILRIYLLGFYEGTVFGKYISESEQLEKLNA